MKRHIIVYLLLILLFIGGCQNSKTQKNTDKRAVVIGYGWNNFAAIIDDIEQIEQLTELFNKAEFIKCMDTIQQPWLSIQFYEKEGVRLYHIDKNNTIKLGDDNFAKSKNINFNMLYTIYNDYLIKSNDK